MKAKTKLFLNKICYVLWILGLPPFNVFCCYTSFPKLKDYKDD